MTRLHFGDAYAAGIRARALPENAIVVGDAGERWRVDAEGRLEPLPPGGHPRPGISTEPLATRRRA